MAVAVICEFNPFHNGHKYLLTEAKKRIKEPVIAIMSGSFVQRGEVAVTDKYSRARTALKNGADLVVELPVVYSVACAERFARGGTEIAKSFSNVNYLAFGCENNDVSLLESVAAARYDKDVNRILNELMSQGDYYPRAFEKAVRSVYGNIAADVLKGANNILALEYINCISDSKIKPVAICRKGAEHNSSVTSGNISSASNIRVLLRNGENVNDFIPVSEKIENITYNRNFERIMLYKLRIMSKYRLSLLPEVTEGLENRIYNAVRNYNSVEEIINAVKTKRYTRSRICRILACAMLDITDEIQQTPIEYVRVLGFTSEGAAILKGCKLNVVTSAAKGISIGGNTALLLEKDMAASDIAALGYDNIGSAGKDYTTPIIKIE